MEFWMQLAAGGALAAGVAWTLANVLCRDWRKAPIVPGAIVRLKSSEGVYRTRCTGVDGRMLRLAAPLQRDRFVPLSVGELVVVEAPLEGGAVVFRSRIAGRSLDSHELLLAKPPRVFKKDRRAGKRAGASGAAALVEGKPVEIENLSSCGICFLHNGELRSGERIAVVFGGSEEPSFAWTLACIGHYAAGRPSHRIRARFEEPISLTARS